MQERPILFKTEMVQAILEGRKTMTRRVIKPQPEHNQYHVYKKKLILDQEHRMWCWKDQTFENLVDFPEGEDRSKLASLNPYGQKGDILWVRESWRGIEQDYGSPRYEYKATETINLIDKWKPSIFMPREACRLRLEITDIKVEWLQDISEEDAIAEGIERSMSGNGRIVWKHYLKDKYGPSPIHSFETLWQKYNGKESWEDNPFVWVISFEKI